MTLINSEGKNELEFSQIIEQIQQYALNEYSKQEFTKIKPLNKQKAHAHLIQVNEYLSSIQSENKIPFHEFPTVFDVLKVLKIENYQLDADAFLRVRDMSKLINQLIVFLEKFKEYFPNLHKNLQKIPFTKEIINSVNDVFNRFGEVKNDASEELKLIREQISEKQKIITELFAKSLVYCSQNNLLDDIRESIVDNQRCLAVKSSLKKRVKGRTLGVSKTGSISFIIPEAIIGHQNRLAELEAQEKHEIRRILTELTYELSIHFDLISNYQKCLLHLDLIQAKARYAQNIDACLPIIKDEKVLKLQDAYNPILLITNRKENKKTLPQTLELSQSNRILCISGPNAGGKSITLKTIGIMQLMIQCGILIPVHPKSEVCFFDKILTDIGDNQSIENHLSTYSARLKKMSEIIATADENTLILIDEFGTGSDPELGGALAESFLDFFYSRKSFAIITTHYTNIKLKIEELPHATNSAMLFDKRTLSPLYKLEVGQAGSSFTFEVAEKNNIPKSIIQKAKKKLKNQKVNLDKTLIQLQQEKYETEKLKSNLSEKLLESENKNQEIISTEENIKKKLFDFQKLYNEEKKYLGFGKKFEAFIKEYADGKTKKQIVAQFMKIVEQEKYKLKNEDKQIILGKRKKEKLRTEIQNKLNKEEVKSEIKEIEVKSEQQKKLQQQENLKVGSKVKIKGSSSVAIIEKIEKEFVFLNYGNFTTKINISEIEKI
ncbi:MAG: DNA mismatch repair protein MutS [Flavobacteriales bacterium]|nr:DNA mismatch repair protein MutS [Flavobacteriales bacterium]